MTSEVCPRVPSISRRAKPDSKSAAIEKPAKTPPKTADWIRTNTYWKVV